jgi:Patatin-like phospholipase
MLEKSSAICRGAATRATKGWESLGIGLIVITLLFSGLALRDLNGLLQGMRASDGPSHTIGSLAAVTKSPGDSVDHAKEVLDDWFRYADETPGLPPEPVDAQHVARWQIVVDAFLFATAYTAAFLWFFVSTAVRKSEVSGEKFRGSVEPIAIVGIVAAVITWRADELENFAEWKVVDRGWDQLSAGSTQEMLSFGGWGYVLWAAAVVKWLTLFLVVVPAFVGLALIRLRRWREADRESSATLGAETQAKMLGRAAWRLRLHFVIVFALAALLLGHEQMPDVIRAWSMEQLALTLLIAVVLMLGLWASGRLLLGVGVKPVVPEGPVKDRINAILARPRRHPFFVAISLAAVCLALWALDLLTAYDVGWGWVILGVGIAVVTLASWVLRDDAPPPEPPKGVPEQTLAGSLPEALAAAVPVVLGLAIFHASFAGAVYLDLWAKEALVLVVGVAAGLLFGLLVAAHASDPGNEHDEPWWAEPVLYGSLGGAAALLGIWLWHGMDELNPSLLVAFGALLGLLGWGFHHALGRQRQAVGRSALGVAAVGGALSICLVAFTIVQPWRTAAHLGGIAVLLGFLLALGLAGSLLVWLADARPAPAGLRALGLNHTPIFAFLFVWLLIASAFDKGGYHDVRRLSHTQPIPAMTVEEAWHCWLEKNGLDGDASGERCKTDRSGSVAAPESAVPIVFVSTSGGGIRAAYWTAVVLDCVLEVEIDDATADLPCSQQERTADWNRSNAVFAMSGISGGGVGLASYIAFLAEKEGATNSGWIGERMNADSLSASIAWWLFVEAPRAFLRFNNATDRAEILERGWERDWQTGTAGGDALGRGLLELQREYPELPLLLLNGTSVADGCRFNTSILDINFEAPMPSRDAAERCRSTEPFDSPGSPERDAVTEESTLPATRDYLDFRCNPAADIPLSSAALLAARFPFVSPAGRIAQDCAGRKVSYVVDGGYLETSGASPIIEILDRLLPLIVENNEDPDRQCVVPFFIQIDNGDAGYRNLSGRPGELNVPLKTLFASRSGRAANARNHAALLFSQRLSGSSITLPGTPTARELNDRYAHFNTYARPGPNPPLGWTLSERSRRHLFSQLGQERNVHAMAEVRSWFAAARTGGLTCERQ